MHNTDPEDVAFESRFLKRYLPFVVRISEKQLTLARNAASFNDNKTMDENNLNALLQLDTAFTKMHVQLLQNDTMDLEVNIKTLDRLLKMNWLK